MAYSSLTAHSGNPQMSSPAPAASPAEDIAPQPDAIIVSPASHEANYTILIGVIAAVSIVFLPLFVLICCNICSRYRALNREAARDLSFQAPSAPNSPKDDFDNTPVPVPPYLYRLDTHLWSITPPLKSGSSSGTQAGSNGNTSRSLAVDSLGLTATTACLLCFEREGDHVLLRCGHSGYCSVCVYTIMNSNAKTCPVCRRYITMAVKVSLHTHAGEFVTVDEDSTILTSD